ncbi:serine/threonine-protein kinase [Myxacorys almedinensis]|uniref:non-specific serine/threonine protein kinase n=1 Tax=Myxacorys almedinensis A TaxID=2690445 RepID=A0A8J7Z834_9CYAN|nr:serine/threonine-protein kinase [Myxacorys almedinensis]NDJ19876.1 protein kinase [Myxacorys almedinensis A]
MQLHCTRPGCSRPTNVFPDLDDAATLKTVQQKFCTNCGMPLILVGRYLPVRLLGRGGFGAAFLGRDRYTPGFRPCVIKQFQPSGNLSAPQLKIAQDLFEREAEALEQLGREHPQIPDLFAFFELSVANASTQQDDKFFYLVQEFIDGQTLEEEFLRQGKFSESEVVKVLKECLKILKFVHENGSIHRDIKLSNIMRHRNGRIYLLDFGAVKYATKAAGNANSSTGIYSIGYAPPEQMAGGQVYPSTDLYALAATCVMLLTGKQHNELFDAYSNTWKWQAFATPSRLLAQVLDQMLLANPSQRLPSAQAALAALSAKPAAAVVAPSAPPPAAAPVVAPPVRRKSALPPFPLVESLGGALFTGFEGGLIAIALVSLLGTTWISGGFWLILLGILVLAQRLRVIEKIDLVILAAVTFGIVGFFGQLHRASAFVALGSSFINVLFLAIVGGLAVVTIAILFNLIYKLISRIL